MTLEGRVAGPWAQELGRSWKELAPSVGSRKLSIDLRNTTYADAAGLLILHDIYCQTAAEFVTSTPWTKYIVEEITRPGPITTAEEL